MVCFDHEYLNIKKEKEKKRQNSLHKRKKLSYSWMGISYHRARKPESWFPFLPHILAFCDLSQVFQLFHVSDSLCKMGIMAIPHLCVVL